MPTTNLVLVSSDAARAAIIAVRDAQPDLCWSGFRASAHGGAFDAYRETMLSDRAVAEFQRAIAFLNAAPAPWLRMNRRYYACSWKGVAERWAGGYVSEGMFLAAALHLGFRVEPEQNGPSAFLNLAPAALNLPPRLSSLNVIPFPSARMAPGGPRRG